MAEAFASNLIALLDNGSSTVAPVNPLRGQTWFDETSDTMKVWRGDRWEPIGVDLTDLSVAQEAANAAVVSALEVDEARRVIANTVADFVSVNGEVQAIRDDMAVSYDQANQLMADASLLAEQVNSEMGGVLEAAASVIEFAANSTVYLEQIQDVRDEIDAARAGILANAVLTEQSASNSVIFAGQARTSANTATSAAQFASANSAAALASAIAAAGFSGQAQSNAQIAKDQAIIATNNAAIAVSNATQTSLFRGYALANATIAQSQATYATNNATTANQQALLSTTHSGNAQTAANIATTQAGYASSNAAAASVQSALTAGHASNANTARGFAVTNATLTAQQLVYATANAVLAQSNSALAASYAGNAQSQAAIAQTQAAYASANASTAQDAKNLTVSYTAAAANAVVMTHPTTFENDGAFFSGDSGFPSPNNITFVNSDKGRVAQNDSSGFYGYVSWKAGELHTGSKYYRVRALIRQVSGQRGTEIRISSYGDAAGTTRSSYQFFATTVAALNVWTVVEQTFLVETNGVYVRPEAVIAHNGTGTTGVQQIAYLEMADVTGQALATTSANIAQSQAGYATANAALAQSNASLSATYAGQAQANAVAAAGQAAIATTQAAYTTANASQAFSNASLSATYSGWAGSNATVASQQATIANTQRAYATANASLANDNRALAVTYAGQALANATASQGSAGVASQQAGYATANASFAQSNASLSATYAGQSQGNAAASSGSASIASTQAGYASANATTAQQNAQQSSTWLGYAASNASIAAQQASYATANAASATQSASVQATIGVASLNKNSTFAQGWVSGQLPPFWGDWSNGYASSIVPGQVSPNAIRFVVAAGQDKGIRTPGYVQNPTHPGFYVLEAIVTLVSGSLVGAGLLCQFADANNAAVNVADARINFATDTSAGAALGAGVVGRTYRFSKLIQITNASVSQTVFYAMGGWSGMATVAAKTIDFHTAVMRPASAIEIAYGNAIPDGGSLSATITDLKNADANLLTNKAEASRVTALEVKAINFPNMLPNSDFSAGKRAWIYGIPGDWGDVYNENIGSYIGRYARESEHKYIISDNVNCYGSQPYSISFNGDGGDGVNTNDGTAVYCSQYDASGTYIPAGDGFLYTPVNSRDWSVRQGASGVSHPNARSLRIVIRKGTQTDGLGVSRIMLNSGVNPVNWSDEATAKDSMARIGLVETATNDGRFATATSLQTLEARYGKSGGNLLTNTDFEGGTGGWTKGGQVVTDLLVNYPYDNAWHPPGENVIGFNVAGSGGYSDVVSNAVSVEGGKWYDLSAYIACHRANANMYVGWYRADGVNLGFNDGPGEFVPGSGGQNLTSYTRRYSGPLQAPSSAAYAIIIFRKMTTNSGSDSWLWICRPMFAECSATANGPPPFIHGNARQLSSRITDAKEVALDAQGKANAKIGVTLDVNGYVSGWSSVNNGTSSDFTITSSKFRLVSPGGGARTEYSDGIWYSYTADNSVRRMYGRPFGGELLTDWTGPNSVGYGSETKANAYVYVSMTSPRFGGSDVPTTGTGSGPKSGFTSVYGASTASGNWVEMGSKAVPGFTANSKVSGSIDVSQNGSFPNPSATWGGAMRITADVGGGQIVIFEGTAYGENSGLGLPGGGYKAEWSLPSGETILNLSGTVTFRFYARQDYGSNPNASFRADLVINAPI